MSATIPAKPRTVFSRVGNQAISNDASTSPAPGSNTTPNKMASASNLSSPLPSIGGGNSANAPATPVTPQPLSFPQLSAITTPVISTLSSPHVSDAATPISPDSSAPPAYPRKPRIKRENTIHMESSAYSAAISNAQSAPSSAGVAVGSSSFATLKFSDLCEEIKRIYEKIKCEPLTGKLADYIPQLSKVDPSLFGISICTVDGRTYSIGDTDVPFCLQSTSKPLSYLLACERFGQDYVHQFVGQEPSGNAFNQFALNDSRKPHNPMINMGAITVASVLAQEKISRAEKLAMLMDFIKDLSGDHRAGFNAPVFISEQATADRNFGLAHFMRAENVFPPNTDLDETLNLYFQACSIEVDCKSLANIAATFAAHGVCPLSGKRLAKRTNVLTTLQLMFSCGMYDYSGRFACSVGLPAKSGVSGCVWAVIPNLFGIAIYSPPLDVIGNSPRAIKVLHELKDRFELGMFDQLCSNRPRYRFDDPPVIPKFDLGSPTASSPAHSHRGSQDFGGHTRSTSLEERIYQTFDPNDPLQAAVMAASLHKESIVEESDEVDDEGQA